MLPANSCAPVLTHTGTTVTDVLGMSIDTMAIALDTNAANRQDGSAASGVAQFGILRWKVKWRAADADREMGAGLAGHPNAATVGSYESTTLSAAGAANTWWAAKWAPVLTKKATAGGPHKSYLAGVAFQGCVVGAAAHSSGCTTAKAVRNEHTKVGGALAWGGALAAAQAYKPLVGPLVKFQPAGTKYITKVSGYVVSDLCAKAKLVVAAWSGVAAGQALALAGSGNLSLLAGSNAAGTLSNTHAARPWHNLDVPGWTACVLHYRCPAAGAQLGAGWTATAATAADCAGTATTTARFPKKRATLAAGKSVKVEAFVSGNAWATAGTPAQKAEVTATGTVLVKLYATCSQITTVTATPLLATVKADAGKTVT